MKSVLSKLLLIIFLVMIIHIPSYSNSVFTPEEIKQLSGIPVKIYFNGENYYSDKLRFNFVSESSRIANYNLSETDNSAFVSSVMLSTERNYYDLQTNNSPQLIWQNNFNINDVHAIYTFSSEPTGWTDRKVQYYYSSDKGVTWSFITDISGLYVSGFASISGLSSGVCIVAANIKVSSLTKTLIYVDAFPGLGSFNSYDPGGTYLWPKIAGGEHINNNNKYFFLSATDTLKYNKSVNTLGNFSGYTAIGKTAPGSYTIAKGNSGLVGIAYVSADVNITNFGDVMFLQSTDNGETFSTPLKIFDADFTTDSLAGFMGISLIYRNFTQPYVAFETIKQTTDGNYFPGAPSKIRVWSPDMPGGQSVVIADTNNVIYAPARGTTDLEAPICRPALGLTASGSVVYCAMMVQSVITGGADSTSYNDIYFSVCGGSIFSSPKRMNPVVPRSDWTYPSPSNLFDLAPFTNVCEFVVQRDTIPGSNVNTPHSATDAKFLYVKADVSSGTFYPAPALFYPFNGATNVVTNPYFYLNNFLQFADIQVSATNSFSNIIHSARVNGSTYQMPLGILNLNTTYYWRARIGIGNELTQWALANSFTTRTTSIQNITGVIPAEFKLYSNYPNPFNPTSKIKFDLPKNSFVKINIFDINGRVVNELVNENLQAGSYETEFSGTNLSSGIYYYRIEAGSFSESKKMILIK